MQVKSIAEALLEHSEILLTFINLPFVLKTFILSIFKWPLKTGFTICQTVWMKLRPNVLSDLIWVQSVCKGYQQRTNVVNIDVPRPLSNDIWIIPFQMVDTEHVK